METIKHPFFIALTAAAFSLTGQVRAGPIHDAATQNDTKQIRKLFDQDASALESLDENSLTPLHITVGVGSLESSAVLLNLGADADAKAKTGLVPLHLAALKGRLSSARLLIREGANVSARTDDGFTPLHMAVRKESYTTAQLLIANQAVLNATNAAGATPLYLAVLADNQRLAMLLIARGADVNISAKHGTPLFAAISRKNRDLVELLTDYGANLEVENHFGVTPVTMAMAMKNKQLTDLLLEKGARPPTRGKQIAKAARAERVSKEEIMAFANRVVAERKRKKELAALNKKTTSLYFIECKTDRIVIYPEQQEIPASGFRGTASPLNAFLEQLNAAAGEHQVILAATSGAYEIYRQVKDIAKDKGVQTRMRILRPGKNMNDVIKEESSTL